MASFVVSVSDIVMISLSAHACLLLRALLGKLVDWSMLSLSHWCVGVRNLHLLHKRLPDLIPRILSEQITLFVISAISLTALSHTSVSVIPFGFQEQPTPEFLIRVVLCAYAARQLVIAFRLLLGREVVLVGTGKLSKASGIAAAGESGSILWDCLYSCTCAVNAVLCLRYSQNLLLGMTLPFLDWSYIPVGYCHVLELSNALKQTRHHQGCGLSPTNQESLTHRRFALVSCGLCIVCRGALPILFFALAVHRESPLVMDRIPLVWFVLSGVFLLAYQWLLLYRAVRRLLNHRNECANTIFRGRGGVSWQGFSPLAVDAEVCCGAGCAGSIPDEGNSRAEGERGRRSEAGGMLSRTRFGSIYDHPDTLTNDIQEDIALVKRDLGGAHLSKLRDVNFGLLRPYDNRNVSCCSYYGNNTPEEESFTSVGDKNYVQQDLLGKINTVRRKEMTKTWLTYKLLTDSLPSSSQGGISPRPFPGTTPSVAHTLSTSGLDPLVLPVLFGANAKLQKYSNLQCSHNTKLLESLSGENSPLCTKTVEKNMRQSLELMEYMERDNSEEMQLKSEFQVSQTEKDVEDAKSSRLSPDQNIQASLCQSKATSGMSDLVFETDVLETSTFTQPATNSCNKRAKTSSSLLELKQLLHSSSESFEDDNTCLMGGGSTRVLYDSGQGEGLNSVLCESGQGEGLNSVLCDSEQGEGLNSVLCESGQGEGLNSVM